jgi:hypothetical protein
MLIISAPLMASSGPKGDHGNNPWATRAQKTKTS